MLIKGVYDLHVHTSPDVGTRKLDDVEMAQRMIAAGMSGCVIKNHYADTSARAVLLTRHFPRICAAGGIVLNRSVGGINPCAVERAGQAGGKFVWFPTMDSLEYWQLRSSLSGTETDLTGCIPMCGEDGELLPAVYDVLDAAKKYGMIICTGHIAPASGMKVIREARKMGLEAVLTHADNPNDPYTIEEQKEAVALGALVEHSYFTICHNKTPLEEVARQIRATGCSSVYLSSDLGQPNSPYPDEGMDMFIRDLLKAGFSEKELIHMTVDLPSDLIGRPSEN